MIGRIKKKMNITLVQATPIAIRPQGKSAIADAMFRRNIVYLETTALWGKIITLYEILKKIKYCKK
jgi:hypothetical protein